MANTPIIPNTRPFSPMDWARFPHACCRPARPHLVRAPGPCGEPGPLAWAAMLTVLVVVALVVGVAGLVAGFLALVTLGRLRRGVGLLGRGAGGGRESFLEASARHAEAAEQTRGDFEVLRGEFAGLTAQFAALGAEFGTLRDGVRGELDRIRAASADLARTDLDQVIDAERVERVRHLDQVQVRIEADFAAMRAELEQLHLALAGETQAERARLAADNSATRDQLRGAIEKVEKVISTALRRIALVRYDAFDDLGGRLSFSLAVLDSRGDGVTLTSLAGREETRIYAKPISAGVGATDLSPEERQAVKAALAG